MIDSSNFLNFSEARQLVKSRLPRGLFEYIDRGTEDEQAIRANRVSFDRWKIKPRVLGARTSRSTGITLFGQDYSSPIVVAPTAFAGLVRFRGETELARAAAEFGIPFCAATEAITSMEDIAGASETPIWFQLYLWNEAKVSYALIERAWHLGVRTLVVTVDTPVMPKREFNTRNGFDVPIRFSARNIFDVATHPRWTLGVLGRYFVSSGLPNFANYPEQYRHGFLRKREADSLHLMPDLSWDHMKDIRARWKGNLIIKGILRADDALRARAMGADGVVISNHGGRNLDFAVSPIDVLREISDCVGESMTVLADSSVQRGSDVFKLLANGAKAVMVGRSVLYGTAAGGRAGAKRMMQILTDELGLTMDLSGCQSISEIEQDLLEARSVAFA